MNTSAKDQTKVTLVDFPWPLPLTERRLRGAFSLCGQAFSDADFVTFK